MIRSRRQVELGHRRTHQALTFIMQFAILPDLPHAHIRVTDYGMQSLQTLRRSRETSDSKSLALYISRGLNSLANCLGGFTQTVSAQLFVIHMWDFDVNINSIE